MRQLRRVIVVGAGAASTAAAAAALSKPPVKPPVLRNELSHTCRATAHRIEKALRRFRKQTNAVGHLRILRNRKTFENSHDKKIRKNKEAAMRMARARRSARAKASAGF